MNIGRTPVTEPSGEEHCEGKSTSLCTVRGALRRYVNFLKGKIYADGTGI